MAGSVRKIRTRQGHTALKFQSLLLALSAEDSFANIEIPTIAVSASAKCIKANGRK